MTVQSRRLRHQWPQWTGYAAAAWSAVYAVLGLLWTLGVPGYPFGEGDVPDARAESVLGETTAAGTAPVIAVLGLAGAGAGLLLARWRPRAAGPGLPLASSRLAFAGRVALAGFGGAMAVLLLAVVADTRPLIAVAYAPAILLGAPFGWPPEPFGKLISAVLPWPVLNLISLQLAGLLFAAATVAFLRRTRDACGNCGRVHGIPARWTTPTAAARWGRVAALVAAIVPFAYALVRWSWVFHLPVSMPAEEIEQLHRTGLVWAGAYLATFAAVGGVLTLGLVRPWGEVWPRWVLGLAGRRVPPALPITAASVVTVALSSTLVQLLRPSTWEGPVKLLQNPMTLWPLWAIGLGVATLAYYYRTRGACRFCSRD